MEDQLRYPIGKFAPKEVYTTEDLSECINRIEALPAQVEGLFHSMKPNVLDITYREGGWTARQVLHHLADSHMNAYIRVKWTLTESDTVIKAYNEKAWAETPENALGPLMSIQLLKALHIKWVALLHRIPPEDRKKEFTHPETKRQVSIERMIALYAWHGEHHLGHLKIIASKA
jgi:hypothetical protein